MDPTLKEDNDSEANDKTGNDVQKRKNEVGMNMMKKIRESE